MAAVSTSIDIKAPPERVWELAMDPTRLDDWVTIHRGLGEHDGGKAHEGVRMDQTLCMRGVNFKVHWELVSCRDAQHAEWHGKGPARSRAETEYTLTPIDGGTRFDYRNEFKAPLGPLGAAASRALVGGVPEREANASLRRLKALAEKS
jgi:uncharacterized protein YndB with AHSA1/START domain